MFVYFYGEPFLGNFKIDFFVIFSKEIKGLT